MDSDNSGHVGKGWASLVKVLDAETERIEATVYQVKEKFGGLRYYADPPNNLDEKKREMFYHLVQAAEYLSFYMCEVCGEPGYRQQPKFWIKTLCEKHGKEFAERG